jgi:hypothetical protein
MVGGCWTMESPRLLQLVNLSQEVDELIDKLQKTLNVCREIDIISRLEQLIEEHKKLKEMNNQLMQTLCGLTTPKTLTLKKGDITNKIIFCDKWSWFIICTTQGNKFQIIRKEGKAPTFISNLLDKGWKIHQFNG